MNQKHSEPPFYISPQLFDNRRFKRRRTKWLERLRQRQQLYMAQMRAQAAAKTERGRQRQGRRAATALPADITIDLLSDEEAAPKPGPLQVSLAPNITLVPVHSSALLLMPATTSSEGGGGGGHQRQRKAPRPRRRHGQEVITASIVLTSDEEEREKEPLLPHRQLMRSPPPLAPLSLSDSVVEEVTVSLVPRSATTANCLQRRRLPPRLSPRQPNGCSTPTNTCSPSKSSSTTAAPAVNGEVFLDMGLASALPDETTVHTVIANRIYELSLSKLREGLASSGMPEYAQDLLPEQLQKLSPALRAKVAPMMLSSPPAPISLKLSSDLSISLISDDDECESAAANQAGGGPAIDLVRPVVAAEAHAAAKLLKQQQPQLSVVQHVQYRGNGAPLALALPVLAQASGAAGTATANVATSAAAAAANSAASSSRRRKLG